MTNDEFVSALEELHGDDSWPKPLHLLKGLLLVKRGGEASQIARSVGTTRKRLLDAGFAKNPVQHVLGVSLSEVEETRERRAAQMLGQLLLGRCAEVAFESIYRSGLHSEELELRDLREGRTDTDYRLFNGRGRPVYRINIKFHGSPFRRAAELVGLQPDDCFALATYKIYSALQKQHEEGLPYIFAIVGVPGLTGEAVGNEIPSRFVKTVAAIDQAPKTTAKRDLEDLVIHRLENREAPVFRQTLEKILGANWYVLSARRAERLLRDKLFDRVFALRLRNFARAFKRAELDMHFSLAQDLVPLRAYLDTLREEGTQKVTTLLERGDY